MLTLHQGKYPSDVCMFDRENCARFTAAAAGAATTAPAPPHRQLFLES